MNEVIEAIEKLTTSKQAEIHALYFGESDGSFSKIFDFAQSYLRRKAVAHGLDPETIWKRAQFAHIYDAFTYAVTRQKVSKVLRPLLDNGGEICESFVIDGMRDALRNVQLIDESFDELEK